MAPYSMLLVNFFLPHSGFKALWHTIAVVVRIRHSREAMSVSSPKIGEKSVL